MSWLVVMNYQFYLSVITSDGTSISPQLCPFSVMSVLAGSVSVVSLKHSHTNSIFFLATSLIFFPSLPICWIDCTTGYIFCPHFCSLLLASPSHSSPECRPTVGYYCLIKGRLGRCSPDKSIKLPLAVPEGEIDRNGFCPSEKVSQGAPLANGVRGCIC